MRPATTRTRTAACFLALSIVSGCRDPSRDEVAAGSDAARVARGRYLVEGLLQCFVCHSERDWARPGGPPIPGRAGAGRIRSVDGEYRLVAPNLTPDPETGIGRWTDRQLGRAIREGIGHDGRALSPRMWYNSFRHLSDPDLDAVIAYLRSREPVDNPLPATVLPPDAQTALNARDRRPLRPVDLSSSDVVERGRGLVALADCEGCHTAWEAPGEGRLLAGGNPIQRGELRAFSTNITPDPSGVPYDAEAFIEVIRTGKQGSLHPIMPWIVFRNLSDEDLRAIHAYLRTMAPVAHFINNHAEPTYCAVCGQVHGLGELNRVEGTAGARVAPEAFNRYTGTYRSDEDDFELEIHAKDGRLVASVDGEPPVELTFLTDTRFLLPGDAAAFEFVVPDHRAARIRTVESDPAVLERVDSL